MFFDEYSYWCKQKGMSPNKVAKLNGLSEASPSHWKSRGLSPRIDVQIKLAKFFGISVEQLNDHTIAEEKATSETDEERAKVALFSGGVEVTDEMWEKVKEFAKFVESQYGSKDS